MSPDVLRHCSKAAFLLLFTLLLSSCGKREPLPLPEFDRAVFEKTVVFESTPSEIGSDECTKLREVFRSVAVDRSSAKWQLYGYLSLYRGQTLLVRFVLFQDPESIGAFRYDGKSYRGYDQELFRSLNWERKSSTIIRPIESPRILEKTLNFSATSSLSESYRLPQP
jgi:hypothetical protein